MDCRIRKYKEISIHPRQEDNHSPACKISKFIAVTERSMWALKTAYCLDLPSNVLAAAPLKSQACMAVTHAHLHQIHYQESPPGSLLTTYLTWGGMSPVGVKSVPTCLHDSVFCGLGFPLLVIFFVVEIHECDVLAPGLGQERKRTINKNSWAGQEGGGNSAVAWRSKARERDSKS